MATFMNFNGANSAVSMADPDLVTFKAGAGASPTSWAWGTTADTDVIVSGSGMTFDALLRATGGRASEVRLDLNDGGGTTPDVQVTNLSVPAALLDDSAESFWSLLLAGTTIMNAQALTAARVGTDDFSVLFGDDLEAATGTSSTAVSDTGGNDVITLGDGLYLVDGDVTADRRQRGSRTPSRSTKPANDQILGPSSAFRAAAAPATPPSSFANATLLRRRRPAVLRQQGIRSSDW